MISITEAFAFLEDTIATLPDDSVPIGESVGRVLSQNVIADVNSPPHDKSVMDGFAIRSADIASGKLRLEIIETVIAGGWPELELKSGQATRIMTGAPIPDGADAVIMVELTKIESEGKHEFVTLVNEAADLITPEKHVLRTCLLYTSPSPRDGLLSRMPSSA